MCLIPLRVLSFTAGTASRSPSVTPRPPSTAPDMKTTYASTQPQPASPSSPASYSPSLPSLMSPTLAARLSFQTLTNLIPVPSMLWSPRSSGADGESNTSAASSPIDHTSSTFVNATVPATTKERTYVPKERQLEKLRLRMEEERKRGRPTVAGLGVQVKKTQTGVLDI